MSGVLIVVRPFGRHQVGDMISDPSEIRDSLRGEHAGNVVATQISASAGSTTKKG